MKWFPSEKDKYLRHLHIALIISYQLPDTDNITEILIALSL